MPRNKTEVPASGSTTAAASKVSMELTTPLMVMVRFEISASGKISEDS